eukprot:1161376-Pelagomonas_calceolata.AAC.11
MKRGCALVLSGSWPPWRIDSMRTGSKGEDSLPGVECLARLWGRAAAMLGKWGTCEDLRRDAPCSDASRIIGSPSDFSCCWMELRMCNTRKPRTTMSAHACVRISWKWTAP